MQVQQNLCHLRRCDPRRGTRIIFVKQKQVCECNYGTPSPRPIGTEPPGHRHCTAVLHRRHACGRKMKACTAAYRAAGSPSVRGAGDGVPRQQQQRPAKARHQTSFTNVLSAAVCLALSARVQIASAGIFPYENMELQVREQNRER